MKALRFSTFGDLSNLRVEEIPTPSPGPGEVLVRVHAASLNPSDVKNVLGIFHATTLPRTPGRDLAGVIVAGDPARIGEEVWAGGGDIGSTRDGSHAEFILLPAQGARPKPCHLSMVAAASSGINYITAYAGVVGKVAIRAGETLLVTGASGGVGSSVIKIARLLGAKIIGVDRKPDPSNGLELSLGSETDDIGARVREFTGGRGVDAVFDTVGGSLFEIALNTLALDGRQVNIVSIGSSRVSFDLSSFYHRRLTLYGLDTMAMDTVVSGAILDSVAPAFDRGEFTAPPVGGTVSLAEAPEAYRRVNRGEVKGKLVIVFPA
ncbi:MAG TPA: zinc-binding alcohol dehydrogenase family protein [Acidobacteriaceae bacterium]|jgi:NADPH:quinone reductase-like Zn-dependent oxidoreductase|nr:zinc-binding alcohol dehydrogenase family protein [Acidobacteriaceae bacterium]